MKTIGNIQENTFDKLVKSIIHFENKEIYGSCQEKLEVNNKTISLETYLGFCPIENEKEFNEKEIINLQYDSLELYELCYAIENDFKIEIPDEKAQNFKQVKDYVNWINNYYNNQ
jgi:acyl carrier protein